MKKLHIDKKVLLSRILTVLNRFTPIIDIAFLSLAIDTMLKKDGAVKVLGYALIVPIFIILYRWGSAFVKVLRSKRDMTDYLNNNRVIAICGKQRVGKSSLGAYMSKCAIGDVYSNVPIKIRGKFTNKLTTKILTIRERIQDNSLLLIDEASIFYNNLKSDDIDGSIFGQAVLCQCVGHFFDGNILYISVDTSRLPKQIRDNYSVVLQVIESRSYKYSLLGDMLLSIAARLILKVPVYTGLRVWTAQHYEAIHEEQYISLLGDKENQFSPVLQFAQWQSFGLDTYDDRYMQAYYLEKPEHLAKRWEALQLSTQDLQLLYDGEVIKYLNRITSGHIEKKSD